MRPRTILPLLSFLSLAVLVTDVAILTVWKSARVEEDPALRSGVEGSLTDLRGLRPDSAGDPILKRVTADLLDDPRISGVWLFSPDGRVLLSEGATAASTPVHSRMEELASPEASALVSALPESLMTPEVRTGLLVASSIRREGSHNDVYGHFVYPIRGEAGTLRGFVGVAYPLGSLEASLLWKLAVMLAILSLALYWLSLPLWVLVDGRERGEPAIPWAVFVLIGNLVALIAYILARRNGPHSPRGSTSVALIFLLVLPGLTCLPTSYFGQEHPQGRDGSIVAVDVGFPFQTFDEWLETRRRMASFDEASFLREYPPERFNEFKTRLNLPWDTFDQWIQALRERFANAGFDEDGFRLRYSATDFERYQEGLEYLTIRYLSDGLEVAGHILKPKDTEGRRLPVIIYNRGGNRDLGRIEFETLYSHFDLVLHGYVVVASQYRGCCGGGGRDEFGGRDIHDVLNLLPIIDSLPYTDPNRIGMFGWSRGGMMTYLALAETDRVAAAVVAAGPTDLLHAIDQRPDAEMLFSELIPDYETDKEPALIRRSALHWAERLPESTPILLLQGSADWRNDPSDVLKMALELQETGHPFRLVFYEGGDHGLTQYEPEVRELISNWFDRYLASASRQ